MGKKCIQNKLANVKIFKKNLDYNTQPVMFANEKVVKYLLSKS